MPRAALSAQQVLAESANEWMKTRTLGSPARPTAGLGWAHRRNPHPRSDSPSQPGGSESTATNQLGLWRSAWGLTAGGLGPWSGTSEQMAGLQKMCGD